MYEYFPNTFRTLLTSLFTKFLSIFIYTHINISFLNKQHPRSYIQYIHILIHNLNHFLCGEYLILGGGGGSSSNC